MTVSQGSSIRDGLAVWRCQARRPDRQRFWHPL